MRAMIPGTKIRLVQADILNIATVSDIGTFDYIEAVGVLHHLPSPVEGIRALSSVLAPEGGIGMMLYGKHGRQGVYQAQAMAKMLRSATPGMSSQGPAMVALTKSLIEELPASNHLVASKLHDGDLRMGGHAGLVDLILHPQDQAYTVGELNTLVQSAGFRINSFALPSKYDPYPMLRSRDVIDTVSRMGWIDQAAFAEHLAGNITMHTVFIVKSSNPISRPNIGDATVVPYLRTFCGPRVASKAIQTGELLSGSPLDLPPSLAKEEASHIAALMDGTRTRDEIELSVERDLTRGRGKGEAQRLVTIAFETFAECSAMGYIRRPKGIKPPITDDQPFCKFDTFHNH